MDEKNGEPLRTSTLSVVKEDDDDDEEIEELVRTSFRKFQSQSAHANLSQMVCSFFVFLLLQMQLCRYANMLHPTFHGSIFRQLGRQSIAV